MSSNRILSRLSRADLRLLEPHLEAVDLPVRRQLEARNKRVENVYFIESGFASVVANGSTKPSIEVGIIGREGMTGHGAMCLQPRRNGRKRSKSLSRVISVIPCSRQDQAISASLSSDGFSDT